MRAWLELTGQGLACQPIDFAICTASLRTRMAERFGLAPDERPVVLFRVGRARGEANARAPREVASSFCEAVTPVAALVKPPLAEGVET